MHLILNIKILNELYCSKIAKKMLFIKTVKNTMRKGKYLVFDQAESIKNSLLVQTMETEL
jgi:hypothetical protein